MPVLKNFGGATIWKWSKLCLLSKGIASFGNWYFLRWAWSRLNSFRINFTVFYLSKIAFPDEIVFSIDKCLVEKFTVLRFSTFLLDIDRLRMKEFLFCLGILIKRLAIREDFIFKEIGVDFFIQIVAERDVDWCQTAVIVKFVMFFSNPSDLISLTFFLLRTGGLLIIRKSRFCFGYGLWTGIF